MSTLEGHLASYRAALEVLDLRPLAQTLVRTGRLAAVAAQQDVVVKVSGEGRSLSILVAGQGAATARRAMVARLNGPDIGLEIRNRLLEAMT